MGETPGTFGGEVKCWRVLVGKPGGKRPLWKTRRSERGGGIKLRIYYIKTWRNLKAIFNLCTLDPSYIVIFLIHLAESCIIFHNCVLNPLNPELNPICYLLALLAHHFLHVSRIRVKSLTLRSLTLYIYGAPILDVSRSHTTTQHSR